MASTEKVGARHRGVYTDATGKKHKTPVVNSKAKAKQLANELEVKARSHTWVDPSAGKVTFSQYFEEQWLPTRIMQANTRATYLSHYNSSLKPEFGHLPLRRILPSTVQAWVTRLEKEGRLEPATIVAKAKALQTILAGKKGTSALSDRLIEFNPCETLQYPVVIPPKVSVFSPTEIDAIFEAMDPWWLPLVFLDAETGLRWGELMGLRVGDFWAGPVLR